MSVTVNQCNFLNISLTGTQNSESTNGNLSSMMIFLVWILIVSVVYLFWPFNRTQSQTKNQPFENVYNFIHLSFGM